MASTEPAPVPPDDKDWTWVLSAPCSACRFDASAGTGAEVAPEVRAAVGRLLAALERPGAAARPQPQIWSPLEYACHVRDVCRIFGARVSLMRATSDPLFANWDQDETAVSERYWSEDPAVVATELRQESERFLADLAALDDDDWQRPGRRTDGSLFTIDSLTRYFAHDVIHHAWDVTEGPVAS